MEAKCPWCEFATTDIVQMVYHMNTSMAPGHIPALNKGETTPGAKPVTAEELTP